MLSKVLVIVKNVKAWYATLQFELDVYVLIHFKTQLTTKLDLIKLGNDFINLLINSK